MTTARIVIAVFLLQIFTFTAFLYSGFLPIGADEEHGWLLHSILIILRENSIQRASSKITTLQSLSNPERVAAGGTHYEAMCADCHLRPDRSSSEINTGLYPQPPNLTMTTDGNMESTAKRKFWVIKHGIKASGMPAWGKSHDDEEIWNLVAFLQQLPGMSPDRYRQLTTQHSHQHDQKQHNH